MDDDVKKFIFQNDKISQKIKPNQKRFGTALTKKGFKKEKDTSGYYVYYGTAGKDVSGNYVAWMQQQLRLVPQGWGIIYDITVLICQCGIFGPFEMLQA